MVSRLATQLSFKMAREQLISEHKVEVYQYGFELLLSSIFNLIGMVILAVVLRDPLGVLLFCIVFSMLRFYAGGRHARTHLGCFMMLASSTVVCSWLTRFQMKYGIAFNQMILIGLLAMGMILVWRFAPTDSMNKILSNPLRVLNRAKSRKAFAIISLGILCLAFVFNQLELSILTGYAMLIEGITLIPGLNGKNGENDDEENESNDYEMGP